MRKWIIAFTTAMVMMVAVPASADPSFGPGDSEGLGNNGPHEMVNNCHPPGQTSDLPQCN
jgi:hypothetical protein